MKNGPFYFWLPAISYSRSWWSGFSPRKCPSLFRNSQPGSGNHWTAASSLSCSLASGTKTPTPCFYIAIFRVSESGWTAFSRPWLLWGRPWGPHHSCTRTASPHSAPRFARGWSPAQAFHCWCPCCRWKWRGSVPLCGSVPAPFWEWRSGGARRALRGEEGWERRRRILEGLEKKAVRGWGGSAFIGLSGICESFLTVFTDRLKNWEDIISERLSSCFINSLSACIFIFWISISFIFCDLYLDHKMVLRKLEIC